ncbi:Cupredoxin [Melampsora americana]|nr:Cupredoxin [Melampsora americana]
MRLATTVSLFSSWLSIVSAASTPAVGSNSFTPNVVLVISQTNVQADCTIRPSVTVNGTSPGPELRFKEGDKLWIRVINTLPEHNSTIHFHGLSQFGSPFADGTEKTAQFAISPNGGYFDYEFHLQPGTAGNYIYHAHVGNQLSTAHGAFIVEDDTKSPYSYDDEITLLMSDYYHAVDEEIESNLHSTPFKWVGEPQSLLVNGHALGTCDPSTAKYGCTSDCYHHTILVKPDTTYRVRVIGITSLAFLYFAFEGHPELDVIGVDGGYVKPAQTNHIEIHSGQRYSFLLKTKSETELKALNGQRDFWGRIESRWRPTRVHGAFVLRYAQNTLDSNVDLRYTENGLDLELNTSFSDLDPQPLVSINSLQSRVSRAVTPDLPAFQKLVPLPDEGVPWLLDAFEPLDPKERAPLASEVNRRIIISGQQLKSPTGTIKWFVNGQSYVETEPELPFLVRAYTTGLKPDYAAALTNNGFDSSLGAYPIKLGEVVEMVFLNLASTTNVSEAHPWHLHGQAAYVVGNGIGAFSDEELAKQEAARKHQPIARDTQMVFAGKGATYSNTTVPTGTQTGWMVLRMKAETPGAFLLHCHIQPHAFMGMGVVLLIGMENLPPLPQDFLKEYITPTPPPLGPPQSYFAHDPNRPKVKKGIMTRPQSRH